MSWPRGNAERIGINNSCLKHAATGIDSIELQAELRDHKDAIKLVIESLVHPEYRVIRDMSEIKAVGHRGSRGRSVLSIGSH